MHRTQGTIDQYQQREGHTSVGSMFKPEKTKKHWKITVRRSRKDRILGFTCDTLRTTSPLTASPWTKERAARIARVTEIFIARGISPKGRSVSICLDKHSRSSSPATMHNCSLLSGILLCVISLIPKLVKSTSNIGLTMGYTNRALLVSVIEKLLQELDPEFVEHLLQVDFGASVVAP